MESEVPLPVENGPPSGLMMADIFFSVNKEAKIRAESFMSDGGGKVFSNVLKVGKYVLSVSGAADIIIVKSSFGSADAG